jgi:hypothetical protein
MLPGRSGGARHAGSPAVGCGHRPVRALAPSGPRADQVRHRRCDQHRARLRPRLPAGPWPTFQAGRLPRPALQGTRLWLIANFRPIAASSRRGAACWEAAVASPPSAYGPSRTGGRARSGAARVSSLTERVSAPTRASTTPAVVRTRDRRRRRPAPGGPAGTEGQSPAVGAVGRGPRSERIASPARCRHLDSTVLPRGRSSSSSREWATG